MWGIARDARAHTGTGRQLRDVQLTSPIPSCTFLPTSRLSFCTTDAFADIAVPYIHFDARKYDTRLLAHAEAFRNE